jgi:hypothetical protein
MSNGYSTEVGIRLRRGAGFRQSEVGTDSPFHPAFDVGRRDEVSY